VAQRAVHIHQVWAHAAGILDVPHAYYCGHDMSLSHYLSYLLPVEGACGAHQVDLIAGSVHRDP
jgi:hypothetical protein